MRISGILILLSAMLFPGSQDLFGTNIAGTWKNHPSFYQQVQQMIDGEQKTYFLLHQQTFNSRYGDYKRNTASLFVYDKSEGEQGIRALAELYDNFPPMVEVVTYLPSLRSLVAYSKDGQFWFVPENGDPYSVSGFNGGTMPGKQHVNSITENPTDGTVWVGATWGFAQVDPLSKSLKKVVKTDYSVDWISQIGNDLVIFSNNKAWTGNVDSNLRSQSSLIPLPIENVSSVAYLIEGGTLKNPANLMPLSSKTFAFFGPRENDGTGFTLATATKNGSSWKIVALADDEIRSLGDNDAPTLKTINNGTANRDGYYIQTKNGAYQLMRGVDAGDNTADYTSKVLKKLNQNDFSGKESASWDFENFWYFTPKEGFGIKKVSDGTWSNVLNPVYPQAPLPFIATYMAQHPTKGIIVGNHGIDLRFDQSSAPQPWLISAYKNGKWEQLTPAFNPPSEFSSNTDYKKVFDAQIESYPLSNPDGLAIDPKNPKYAYAGSMYSGWARINLENPSELPLHAAISNNAFNNTPGFVDDFPVFSAWSNVCDISAPSFDNEGRLWMLHYNVDNTMVNPKKIVIVYYTAEEIKAMENANTNPSSFVKHHELEVIPGTGFSVSEQLIALKHPDSKNILALHGGNYGTPIVLYNHNGTPGNTADDKIVILENMKDAINKAPVSSNSPVSIWEDTETGKIWVSNLDGTFTVDPKIAFSDPENAVIRQRVKSTGSDKADKVVFETTVITGGAVDDMGNLWLASNNSGLYCLSKDRDELLAEFNVTNSPLPSNRLYSVAYIPESKSILVSTHDGIVEFFPELLGSNTAERVRMSPPNIDPAFMGWVTFSGLPSGKTYSIKDSKGNVVATLGNADGGTLQWNVENENGKRPETGVYKLTDSQNVEYLNFHLLK